MDTYTHTRTHTLEHSFCLPLRETASSSSLRVKLQHRDKKTHPKPRSTELTPSCLFTNDCQTVGGIQDPKRQGVQSPGIVNHCSETPHLNATGNGVICTDRSKKPDTSPPPRSEWVSVKGRHCRLALAAGRQPPPGQAWWRGSFFTLTPLQAPQGSLARKVSRILSTVLQQRAWHPARRRSRSRPPSPPLSRSDARKKGKRRKNKTPQDKEIPTPPHTSSGMELGSIVCGPSIRFPNDSVPLGPIPMHSPLFNMHASAMEI